MKFKFQTVLDTSAKDYFNFTSMILYDQAKVLDSWTQTGSLPVSLWYEQSKKCVKNVIWQA